MTQEYVKAPDATLAVIDILSSAPEIQALHIRGIRDDFLNFATGMRWIRVQQSGGSFHYPWKIQPRIDIEAYGAKRSETMDIINTAVAVIYRAQGSYVGQGLRLSAVTTEMAPYQVGGHHLSGETRYVCSLRLLVRPTN